MNNYFDFFGIDEEFDIDVKKLRALYIENSRRFHPDFFTLGSDEERKSALINSTLNNEAYTCLSDEDLRLKHLLEVRNILTKDEKEKVSQDFLFEMMEINEALSELMMQKNPAEAKMNMKSQILDLRDSVMGEILKCTNSKDKDWERLKESYFRKKYISRLLANLEGLN